MLYIRDAASILGEDCVSYQIRNIFFDNSIHRENPMELKKFYYKKILDFRDSVCKKEYLETYTPIGLPNLYYEENIYNSFLEYFKKISSSCGNIVKDNFKKYFNGNLSFLAVVDEVGDLYMFNRKEGFKSHDEVIENLITNNKTSGKLFLEVGSTIAISKNEFPVIRIQNIDDTNINLSEDLRNYIINKKIARSVFCIYQIFNSKAQNKMLFEDFLANNVSHLGFDGVGDKNVLSKNLEVLKDSLGRDFDADFFRDKIDQKNFLSFDNNIILNC